MAKTSWSSLSMARFQELSSCRPGGCDVCPRNSGKRIMATTVLAAYALDLQVSCLLHPANDLSFKLMWRPIFACSRVLYFLTILPFILWLLTSLQWRLLKCPNLAGSADFRSESLQPQLRFLDLFPPLRQAPSTFYALVGHRSYCFQPGEVVRPELRLF